MPRALPTVGFGFLLLVVAILSVSFTTLSPTEVALGYNWALRVVHPAVVDQPGLKLVGPFVRFFRYPKTIQTLEYTQTQRELLDGRTKDGLPLILGVSFQYRIFPEKIYDLYRAFDNRPGDYVRLYRLVGIHIVTEMATQFTANQFFNDKQRIASKMQEELDKYFQTHLFATVESLQINEDDLPDVFTQKIQQAANTKLQIQKTQKNLEAQVVAFATARVVARAQANVTIQGALGQRHRIHQAGFADASVIQSFVQGELEAYGTVKRELGLSADSLVRYMWFGALSGQGIGASLNRSSSNGGSSSNRALELLVGVNPAAYISESKGQ